MTDATIEYHQRMLRVDNILTLLRAEIEKAVAKHPPMHSPHEGYSVILEELDELWDEVKADRGRNTDALLEALQTAAMEIGRAHV